MLSSQFNRYIELPFVGEGISREEAFYDFLKAHVPLEKQASLKQEFFSLLLKELAANPLPFFKVECVDIRKRKKGRLALVREEGKPPYLYASLEGKFIHGPITPLLAELIENETVSKALRQSSDSSLHSVVVELHKRGMLD